MGDFYFGASNSPDEGPSFYIYSANTNGTSTLEKSGVKSVYVSATGYALSGTEYKQVITTHESSSSNGYVSFPGASAWESSLGTAEIAPSPDFYRISKLSLGFTYLGRTYSITTTGGTCQDDVPDFYVGPQNEDGVADIWNISPTYKNEPIPIPITLGLINISGRTTDGTLKSGICRYSISTANVCTSNCKIITYKTFSKEWTSGAGANFTKWTSAWTVSSWPDAFGDRIVDFEPLSTANNILGATASPFYVTAITATVCGGSSTTQQWNSVTKYHTITGSTSSTTTTSVKLDNEVIPQTITRSGVTFQSTSGYMGATGGKWKVYNTVSSARTDEDNMIWSGWVTNYADFDSTITISGETNASISVERDGFETFNADASSLNTDEAKAYPWEVTVELNKDENNSKLATINNFKEGSAWKNFGRIISGSIAGDAFWADRVMTYASMTDIDGSDGVQRQYPPFCSITSFFYFSTPSYSGESEDYEWEDENGLVINSGATLPRTYHSMSSWATDENGLGIICPRAIKSSDILRNIAYNRASDVGNGSIIANLNKTIVPKGFVDARFVFNGEETSAVPYNWCVSGVQTSGYVMAATLPHKYLTTDAGKWQITSAGTMSGVSGMRAAGPHGISGDEAYFIISCDSANTSTTALRTATFYPARDGVSGSVTVTQSIKPSLTFSGTVSSIANYMHYFSWDEFGKECGKTTTVITCGATYWSINSTKPQTIASYSKSGYDSLFVWRVKKPLAGDNAFRTQLFYNGTYTDMPYAEDAWGNKVYNPSAYGYSNMVYFATVPSASGCTIKKINQSTSSANTEVTSVTFLATDSGSTTRKYFYFHLSGASNLNQCYRVANVISGTYNCAHFTSITSTASGYTSIYVYPKSANTSTTPNIVQYTITPISTCKYHDGTYISGVSKTITVTQVAGGGK